MRAIFLAVVLVLVAAQPALPPVSWTCPMHAEIVDDRKGACPICRMDLVPVRLDTVWSCPVHQFVAEARGGNGPGTCPICRRDLVQVLMAVSWTCPNHPEIDRIDPGVCPGGAAAVRKLTPRPHGNHNPQHGGTFFMAPDNWHHLEGTYTQDGRFRLYLYDDYSRPLPLDKMKLARGRVGPSPLLAAAGREYLEASVAPSSPPTPITAMVAFEPKGPEYRFDFTFAAAAGTDLPSIPPMLSPIPDDVNAALRLLDARRDQIKGLIERGNFAEIYVPALQAKDLALAALAIVTRAGALSSSQRASVDAAVKQVVRAAWRLDASGDLGDRTQVADAYAAFAAGVAALESALEPLGPLGQMKR